jgi:anti-sigma regulatory factor (Ser/Thr protein kinase)
MRLPSGADAARAARRLVEEELGEVLDAQRMADARLLVSEVVTNAIRHGDGDGPVTMTIGVAGGAVRVEVRDPGDGFVPPPAQPDPQLPGGRGLMLVDMLSERWGVDPGDGTCVWFELPVA